MVNLSSRLEAKPVATHVQSSRVHCSRVDGLPGEPCKTCGRMVVRKGTGKALYRLTHAQTSDQTGAPETALQARREPVPTQHTAETYQRRAWREREGE
jgi:hypothetical protein